MAVTREQMCKDVKMLEKYIKLFDDFLGNSLDSDKVVSLYRALTKMQKRYLSIVGIFSALRQNVALYKAEFGKNTKSVQQMRLDILGKLRDLAHDLPDRTD